MPHDPKLGETVRVSVLFADDAGTAMAASGVTINARKPDGTEVAGTVSPGSGTGQFTANFTADLVGSWLVKAECTGPLVVRDEKPFTVSRLRWDIA